MITSSPHIQKAGLFCKRKLNIGSACASKRRLSKIQTNSSRSSKRSTICLKRRKPACRKNAGMTRPIWDDRFGLFLPGLLRCFVLQCCSFDPLDMNDFNLTRINHTDLSGFGTASRAYQSHRTDRNVVWEFSHARSMTHLPQTYYRRMVLASAVY